MVDTPRTPDPDFDPWLDPQFAQIDLRKGPGDMATKLTEIANSGDPDVPVLVDEVENPPAPDPEPVAGEQPEVYEYPDGSSVTIENIPTGVKATVSVGEGGGDQVYYGKDRNELLNQVLSAQLNATKKIRQQNKQLKLTATPRAAGPISLEVEPQPHELTVDEKFEIKTKLADDPDLAIQDWFQKKTGMSVEELTALAQEGRAASDAVVMDTEARAFKEETPRYACTSANFRILIGYLAKEKLNVELTQGNEDEVLRTLVRNEFFSRTTLAEAYEALVQDGLLELLPEETEPPADGEPPATPPPPPPKPVTPTVPPAGIPRRAGPRAAKVTLGIKPSSTSGLPPDADADRAPSVEELDNLSTEDVGKLLAGVRQLRARTRR
jgi:hypothetical protein